MKYLLSRLVLLGALCLLYLGLSNPPAYACLICVDKACNTSCVAALYYCAHHPTGVYADANIDDDCAQPEFTNANQCDELYCDYFCPPCAPL
jgi:hypothetical protein